MKKHWTHFLKEAGTITKQGDQQIEQELLNRFGFTDGVALMLETNLKYFRLWIYLKISK